MRARRAQFVHFLNFAGAAIEAKWVRLNSKVAQCASIVVKTAVDTKNILRKY